MKRYMVAVLVFLVALSMSSTVFAQGQGKAGGHAKTSQYQRLYNPSTVETVSGEVVSIGIFTPAKRKRMGKGVHLELKTDKETIAVHLGPSGYINEQNVKIEKGDRIKVTGSRVIFEGKPAIIAQTIVFGNETLKLRDENGIPLWAGSKRSAKK
jgi:hypothetical protein